MPLLASVASAIKKVAKAVPEGKAKDFVGDVIGTTFKKGESSWAFNYHAKEFKPVAFLPGTHYSLKKRYSMGVPLAVAAIEASRGAGGMQKDARLSDMQADEMSNTINSTRSPGIKDYEQDRNPDVHTKEELAEAKRRTPYELRTGGASGDLVFALHNLKGGA